MTRRAGVSSPDAALADAGVAVAPAEQKIGRRLLAVDPGSNDVGFAFFTGNRVEWTRRLSPPDWSWGRRMRWLTDRLRDELVERSAVPDVVAIEGVAFGVNARSAVTMAEQRGWIACALEHWYPGIRQMAINPSTVKSAVAAPRDRELAKRHIRWAVESMTGLTGLSQDECDAIAIGLAAIAELKHAELLERAGIRPAPKPRRRARRAAPTGPQLVLGQA